MSENEYIVFDVIGTKFRLKKNLFKNYDSSLFYELINVKDLNLPVCLTLTNIDEYYVQRSADVFKIVVLYCINGKLHVPNCVCSDEIAEEFQFWKIKYEKLCSLCACNHQTSEKVKVQENVSTTIDGRKISQPVRMRLWTLLEDPHSSWEALVFLIISMMVIVISILNIIVSSIPELQFCPNTDNSGSKNGTKSNDYESEIDPEDDFEYTPCIGTYVFNMIDMCCMIWFTIELLLRFVSCQNYKTFFTSALIIIDILSILPFYLELIMWLIDANDSDKLDKTRALLMILRIFKVFRIFRVLKLARFSLSLKVLGKTIKAARSDLGMLSMFIIIAMLIFSNCLYQIEKDQTDSKFTSIPATFWWCIVTLSTVGYGDMSPETIFGKMIAGLACICGVLLIAFPIAVLVEKFTKTYNEEKKKEQEIFRRKRFSNQQHNKDIDVYKF